MKKLEQQIELINKAVAAHKEAQKLSKREALAMVKVSAKTLMGFCDVSKVLAARAAHIGIQELFDVIYAFIKVNEANLEPIPNKANFKSIEAKAEQQITIEEGESKQGQQVGYIRVSTVGQNTARQLVGLKLDKVFEEKVSAKTMTRPELAAAKEYCREGDTLHIHSIDRVCRTGAGDAVTFVKEMINKGVNVVFHDGQTFSAKLTAQQEAVLAILAAAAKLERDLINERRAEGQAAAKAAGRHVGRPIGGGKNPKSLGELLSKGYTVEAAASKLGISTRQAYRLKKQLTQENLNSLLKSTDT